MSLYEDTIVALRGLAEAATAEDALFCERRPLTSLEAGFAKADDLASRLRVTENAALDALGRLVDAEEGYEVALAAIEAAGPQVGAWLGAVTLARALESRSARTARRS